MTPPPTSASSGGPGWPVDAAAEIEPAVAGAVFGDRTAAARRYAQLLTGPGVERGLVGPREASRIWTRHLLNCAVLGDLLVDGSVVADVGSGAGLPGIPLALARTDVRVVLVEPLLRRSTFLSEVVADLGLANVSVVRARAEDLVPRRGWSAQRRAERPSGSLTDEAEVGWQPVDVVTSRAVAPLDRLAAWCTPLLRAGGSLVAMKGSSAADELRSARPALDRLGLRDIEVVTVGSGVVDPPTIVVRGTLRDPGSGDSPGTSPRSSARPAGGGRRSGRRPR